MRLLVDASAAVNQGAGIGRYARMLLPLLAAGLPDSRVTALIAVDPASDITVRENGMARLTSSGMQIKSLPVDRRWADILWFRARLPLDGRLFAGRTDLVYSPDFTAPPVLGAPAVVTVHDLAFEVMPQFAPPALRAYLRSVVPRQVNRAVAVAVVSETTAGDLQERYRVPPEKISIVRNGVDERFFAAKPLTPSQRSELGIPESYLLMVGTIEPRKNHIGALAAHTRSETGRCAPLVVAGRRGWDDAEIVRRIEELQVERRVIWLRYAPEELLPSLYAGALATVYPSWYEGFGLPALEALAAGSPLVVSRAPALTEIAGGVARQAEADDIDGLAAAIDDAVRFDRSDEARLRRKERAALYRWETSGASLTELVRRVAGR